MNGKRRTTRHAVRNGLLLAAVLLGSVAAAQGKAVEQKAAEAKAAPAPSAEDEIMVLKQRAAAFWQARINRDFRAQWELLEPRVKGRVAADEYSAGRGGVRYLAYQVEDVTTTGLFATVKVRVLAQPAVAALVGRRITPQAVLLDDPWVRVGGVWYRRLESDESGPPQRPAP